MPSGGSSRPCCHDRPEVQGCAIKAKRQSHTDVSLDNLQTEVFAEGVCSAFMSDIKLTLQGQQTSHRQIMPTLNFPPPRLDLHTAISRHVNLIILHLVSLHFRTSEACFALFNQSFEGRVLRDCSLEFIWRSWIAADEPTEYTTKQELSSHGWQGFGFLIANESA